MSSKKGKGGGGGQGNNIGELLNPPIIVDAVENSHVDDFPMHRQVTPNGNSSPQNGIIGDTTAFDDMIDVDVDVDYSLGGDSLGGDVLGGDPLALGGLYSGEDEEEDFTPAGSTVGMTRQVTRDFDRDNIIINKISPEISKTTAHSPIGSTSLDKNIPINEPLDIDRAKLARMTNSAGFREVSDIDPAKLANSKSVSKQTNIATAPSSKRQNIVATEGAPTANYTHLYVIAIALLVGFLISRGMFHIIGKKPPLQPPL